MFETITVIMSKNQQCDFNRGLKCNLKRGICPLQDFDFTRDLERFLYTGRTPPGIEFKPLPKSQNAHGFKNYFDERAKMATIFSDEIMDDYMQLDNFERYESGKYKMTYRKCRIWESCYQKWIKTR